MVYKIMITGHRNLSPSTYHEQLERYLGIMRRQHNDLEIITGMALGVDQAFAKLGFYSYPPVPVHAYIPYYGQCRNWNTRNQVEYYRIIERCKTINVTDSKRIFTDASDAARAIRNHNVLFVQEQLSTKHATRLLMQRNQAMVDACDEAVAVFIPERIVSGTAETIKMIEKSGKPLTEIRPE